MNKIIFLLLICIAFILPNATFAEKYLDNVNYKQTIEVWQQVNINLSDIRKKIEKDFWSKVSIEWNIKWEDTIIWDIFNKTFKNIWDKKISLNIYKNNNKERRLIIEKYINIYIYKNNLLLIVWPQVNNDNLNNLITSAKESWIYITVKHILSYELPKNNLLEIIKKHSNINKNYSNYTTIWWSKNFLINSLSILNKEIEISEYNKKLNFSFISSFNINILENYLNNFLSNKLWINNIIMIDETSKSQIIKNPWDIIKLKKQLIQDKYNFLELSPNNKINKFLFISNFINNLSWKGLLAGDIYLLLIIPFLLTLISIQKHLIWLNVIWITIPIFITILLFKIWILISLIVLITITITNLLLSKIINRYTLLYTPKVSFIIIINTLTMIIVINLLYNYNLLNINTTNSLFIILFIVISERLITIILSKDFTEYKINLFNTILFSLVSFFIFSLNIINTFILAYPEIILLLIPLNFIIWRFTWLRVTEYFRFKEVIKNIEE